MEEKLSGVIFNIARFCISDGPGVRTTVFLKGCPLHCVWCHNPEGLSPMPQLVYERTKCAACGACLSVCPKNCHILTNGLHRIDFSKCTGCGACLAACRNKAISIAGKTMTVSEVTDTAVRDIPYYDESSGGVTLSGGEVLFQPEFAIALLKALKARGIHTCIETSGAGAPDAAKEVFCLADLVLMDFKHGDPELLKKLTGLEMERFIRNMELLQALNKPVILRCPIIKGVNTSDTHFSAVADIANRFSCIYQIEFLPYHNLGCEKSVKMNLPYQEFETPSKDEIVYYIDFLKSKTGKNVLLL